MNRTRTALIAAVTLALAACGTPATPFPAMPPTLEFATRVPVATATGGPQVAAATTAPTVVAAQPTVRPTRAPIQATPTITLIPPTPTPAPPTATPAPRDPDPAIGKTLFESPIREDLPACNTCHLVAEASETDQLAKPGPTFWSNGVDFDQPIGIRAASRVPGQSAAAYIRRSIVAPNEFFVPNSKIPDKAPYSVAGNSLMFQLYGESLTEQQIGDLVAYILTIK